MKMKRSEDKKVSGSFFLFVRFLLINPFCVWYNLSRHVILI